MRGDLVTARSLTEEALALFREMGEKERIAWSLSTLGLLDIQEGVYSRAYTLLEESLAIHRESGDKSIQQYRKGYDDMLECMHGSPKRLTGGL